jgi:squalene-associated FAD-dependent desaturase
MAGFWQVILVSALGDTVDRVSVDAARKVLVDGFMGHRRAYEVLVPRRPLSEILDGQVGDSLSERGVQILRSSPVRELNVGRSRVLEFEIGGTRQSCDAAIIATAWRHADKVLSENVLAAHPALLQTNHIESAPITGVHLWFDRPITDLPHCILVGRLSQWIFARPIRPTDGSRTTGDAYYQVVISGSHELQGRPQSDIIAEVHSDLRLAFPCAQDATLLRGRIVTDPHAVFSCRPGLQRLRQTTAVPNLFVAGDWTHTGWPATMEGAVRSGYLAAEGVLAEFGRPASLVVPELPRSWLARICGS